MTGLLRLVALKDSNMLILAFETSTDLASCALLNQQQVVSVSCPRSAGQNGQHSATLLPAAKQLLAESGVSFAELDAIAFGAGPGAFTGLRMACAVAQGIAVAHDKPIIPITTLAAMAWQAGKSPATHGKTRVVAWLDARMGEIYEGRFSLSHDGITQVGNLNLSQPDELSVNDAQVVCGNVFNEHPLLIGRLQEHGVVILENLVPSAIEIAELARFAWQRQAYVAPELAAPLYVRDRVAKTVAERLAEGGRA